MLTVKLSRSYVSKNGHTTFVYAVKGSQAELKQFEDAQGEFHRVDDVTGEALWFTTRCIGQTGKLLITTNGNVVPDMSEFDQAASLAAQYGGNFGQELAKAAAQRLVGGSAPRSSVPAQSPVDDNADIPADLPPAPAKSGKGSKSATSTPAGTDNDPF